MASTIVKKVTVGVPISGVTSGAFNINNLEGVDTTSVGTGDILVYDASNSKFVADSDTYIKTTDSAEIKSLFSASGDLSYDCSRLVIGDQPLNDETRPTFHSFLNICFPTHECWKKSFTYTTFIYFHVLFSRMLHIILLLRMLHITTVIHIIQLIYILYILYNFHICYISYHFHI